MKSAVFSPAPVFWMATSPMLMGIFLAGSPLPSVVQYLGAMAMPMATARPPQPIWSPGDFWIGEPPTRQRFFG